MSTALEAASLVMVPSGYEDGTLASVKPNDGTGDFTFSRGSDISATRVNADGYIEKGYENLLYPSNDFSVWNKTRTSITSGQIGYDGSTDAWLLEALVTSQCWISKSHSATGICSFSVYAKANTATGVLVAVGGTSGTGYARFDLANGVTGSVVGNGVASSIEAVGDGWYRCSMFTTNTTITLPLIYVIDDVDTSNATAGNSIYIQDAQLNQGLVAYPYIETTTAPVAGGILEDMPRLDYSNGSCPALLLEPQRTNLVTQSEHIKASVKSSGITISSNHGISPEGYKNSSRIQSTSGNQYVYDYGGTINTGEIAVMSIYAKGIAGEQFRLYSADAGAVINQEFTLTSEWKRYSATTPATTSSGSFKPFILVGYGSTSPATDFEVYGWQTEIGSYPTSYIPTYGVSQTRLKDVCNGAGDASTFNSAEGVLYAEIETLANINLQRNLSISDGTHNNTIKIGFSNNSNYIIYTDIRLGGVNQAFLAYNFGAVAPTFKKCAIKYKQNDFALWIDGVEVATDTSGDTFPENTLNTLSFTRGDNGQIFEGKAKQVLYFPTALTDSECIELTTI